jgi:branched-chain amino acid transport system substrate-binding protein
MAADWINKKGGVTIKGEKYFIEIMLEDSKESIDGAVTATTKLVTRDEVKFLIGFARPDLAIAVHSITEPAKVIKVPIFGAGLPPVMSAKTPYTFRATPCGAEAIPINYDYIVQAYPNTKKVAIVSDDTPGGKFFAGVSENVAKAHGLTVVFSELYPFGQEDFYPLWSKIIAAKPDAVDVGPGFLQVQASILKQGRELRYSGPIFSISAADLYEIRDAVGKDFADNYYDGSFDPRSPDLLPGLKQIAKSAGGVVNADQPLGWDPLWCLVQAIEKAQSLDTSEVAAAWEKMSSIETSMGTGHMGGLKTYGINHLAVRPMPISKLEKGDVKFIGWVMPSIP